MSNNRQKRYITQLTKQEIADLLAAADPVPGFCVRIEKTKGQLKIGIDENALKLAINGFFRNGGCQASAANCLNIKMDPPS